MFFKKNSNLSFIGSILFAVTFLVGGFFISNTVLADATVTEATGGSAISADSVNGEYTTLTGPIISENVSGDIGTGLIILNAPSGFIFDTSGTAPTVRIECIGGCLGYTHNINNTTSGNSVPVTSIASTQITKNIAQKTDSGVTNSLTWQNIRVRPTSGNPLATGNITDGTTNFGTLTETAGTLASIIVSPSTLSLTIGGATQTLTTTILDQFNNATTGTLTWTSSAPSVATVDSNGVVTAVSAGSSNITASSGEITSAIPSVITVNVIKVDQATLTVNAISEGVIYGTTATLGTTGGSGTGAVTYSADSSTGCSITEGILSVTNISGTCSITATKATDTNYNATTSELLIITLHKADSNITSWPTATGITYGQTLANSTLSGGSSTPDGTFAFTTPTTAPNAGIDNYEVTFTPTDINNYNEATGSVSVTVNKATRTTSGSYIRAIPATPVTGQVLGAEKFNFTKFLKFKALSYKVSLQGAEVMELQKLLNNSGNTLIIDGKFGPKTKGAVIKFQIANSLKGDGVIGALTRAVLNK